MLALLVIWVILTMMIKNRYYTHLIFMVTIYAVMACGLNIVVGITGLANMSQAAFFGIGAYVAAILSTEFGMPFYVQPHWFQWYLDWHLVHLHCA